VVINIELTVLVDNMLCYQQDIHGLLTIKNAHVCRCSRVQVRNANVYGDVGEDVGEWGSMFLVVKRILAGGYIFIVLAI
jgi:hypothetical protein